MSDYSLEEALAAADNTTEESFVINSDLRTIQGPQKYVLGVFNDQNVQTVHFKCHRYYNGIDYNKDMINVWPDYNKDGITAIERKARTFISKLHEQYPNCKIILEGYHNATVVPRNIHVGLPYDMRNKFIWELTDLYESFAKEFSYCYFVHVASQFDVYHGLKTTSIKPNIRADEMVEYVTDDVHPSPNGYYQYSDAEVRCLMYLMQNI